MHSALRRCTTLVLAAVLTATGLGAAASDGLEQVQTLAEAGAPELALWVIDREQPDAAQDTETWMGWERERVRILRERGRWRAAIQRLSALPEGLPEEFRAWAQTERAAAHVSLDEGGAALELLRGLIWASPNPPQGETLAGHRRLIIRAYLAADRVADARTAALRYGQDYGAGDADWRRLRSRVLLHAGDPGAAARLLAQDQGHESDPLYLLAQLESRAQPPRLVQRTATRLAREEGLRPGTRRRLWAVAARAAGRADDGAEQIQALSRAIALPGGGEGADGGLLTVRGDDLWRAYLEFGRELGNRLQLLVGDDERWYETARQRLKDLPMDGRALYAVLTQAPRPGTRTLAHEQFATSLAQEEGGQAALQALYLEENRYATLDDLPESVRRGMVDYTLARGELRLASRLMGEFSRPPQDVADAWFWRLRRARILVMGGDLDRGVQALLALIQDSERLPRSQLDRLMQVLFDLQKVGRHEDAIALFAMLPLDPEDKDHDQLRREVLYWTADSYKAMGDYRQAARHYLRSATLLDPKAMDPWAQTARYQAADALAQAGLHQDARRLYRALLRVAEDDSRRIVLRSKLQQLWLEAGTSPN